MSELGSFLRAVQELERAGVRYVLIGVSAANHYAREASAVIMTADRDLFLPPDPENLLRAWQACTAAGLELRSAREALDEPRDRWLAEQVVARRALVRATDGDLLQLDLTLVMAGHDFETVWRERRTFQVRGVAIPVARLRHVVDSKASADRPKDRLFLATYGETLREWMEGDEGP